MQYIEKPGHIAELELLSDNDLYFAHKESWSLLCNFARHQHCNKSNHISVTQHVSNERTQKQDALRREKFIN